MIFMLVISNNSTFEKLTLGEIGDDGDPHIAGHRATVSGLSSYPTYGN